LGTLGQQLQRCVEIALRHFAQRPAAIFTGEAQGLAREGGCGCSAST
jgi:hypothetical protein